MESLDKSLLNLQGIVIAENCVLIKRSWKSLEFQKRKVVRMTKLNNTMQEFVFRNVLTIDDRICYLAEGSANLKTYYG